MSAQTEHLRTLGQRIRAQRKKVGKSLKVVADETGLSIAFLSQLERDISSPSLASLRLIANSLGTAAHYFMGSAGEPSPVSKSGRRKPYCPSDKGPRYERLSDEFLGSKLSSVIINLPAGYEGQLMTHEGEEIMYVLEGSIRCDVNGETRLLEKGDSIHYSSHLPHRTRNPSVQPAKVLWVGTLRIFSKEESAWRLDGEAVLSASDPLHFDLPDAENEQPAAPASC